MKMPERIWMNPQEVEAWQVEKRVYLPTHKYSEDAVEYIRADLVPRWIPVGDRLPEIDDFVLWLHENGSVFQEHIDKDVDENWIIRFLSGAQVSGPITHWMPVPPLPREGGT